ncbi:MAG: DUF4296 domain-containing protein [Bacteroidales bacterium]|nr:DUF4296 domain-containing protein [Bacteroidales bacterium]
MKRNMIPWCALLCMVLLAGGCNSGPDRTEKPTPYIPPDTMETLMTEIYQLEATLQVCERKKRENIAIYGKQQWEAIMRRHRITTDVWESNLRYYLSQRTLSDTLLSRVTNRLSAIEAAKAEAMRKAADSMPIQAIPTDGLFFEELIFN